MRYSLRWLHGRLGPLPAAIHRYKSLFLTDDYDFARGYGTVYEITLRPGLTVFDTADPEAAEAIVQALWHDHRDDMLDPELDGVFERLFRDGYDLEGVLETLGEEITPSQIRSESIYDDAAFQAWLTARGIQLVLFRDRDTALVLDAECSVSQYRLARDEDW